MVIDLSSLADHPELVQFVMAALIPDGRIEGQEISPLSDNTRQAAGSMVPFLGGEFQTLAVMFALRYGEPEDGGAGPFDTVSAQYLAAYWFSMGAMLAEE